MSGAASSGVPANQDAGPGELPAQAINSNIGLVKVKAIDSDEAGPGIRSSTDSQSRLYTWTSVRDRIAFYEAMKLALSTQAGAEVKVKALEIPSFRSPNIRLMLDETELFESIMAAGSALSVYYHASYDPGQGIVPILDALAESNPAVHFWILYPDSPDFELDELFFYKAGKLAKHEEVVLDSDLIPVLMVQRLIDELQLEQEELPKPKYEVLFAC